jgi:hypothetical protein
MTSKLAFAVLAAALFAPVARAQEPTLSAADLKKLQGMAQKWFEPWHESRELPPEDKRQRKLQSDAAKEREKVVKEWETRSKKADLLGSMVDLRAIFAQPFSHARINGSGLLKSEKATDRVPAHAVFIPKTYKAEDAPLRAIVVLPGMNGEKWQGAREYFADTWEGTTATESSFFVVADVPEGMDFDPLPDYSQPNGEVVESSRIKQVLLPMGSQLKPLNYDRNRLFLDCGKGNSAFGLRLASYFPYRFAGIVVRDPTALPPEVRLGSLMGVPVLLLASAETKAACDALSKALNDLEGGKCTVLEGKGAYPWKESQPEIEAWIASQLRPVDRSKLIVEPNSDKFRKVHWANITQADPLLGTAPDKRVRLLVEADRSANRIKVETRGVEQFQLLLNDSIVDLSREFTVDVNGKLFTERSEVRSFSFMTEQLMTAFDPTWIFTAEYSVQVPKAEK